MKLFAISDLHLSFSTEKPMDVFGSAWDYYFERISEDWKGRVTDDDVVLLSGDLSWGMSLSDAAADLAALDALPGKKVIIRGNHDYWWSSYAKVKQAVKNTAIIPVQNDAVKLGTHVICGTRGWDIAYPNSTDDDKKIYARELIRLEMSLTAAEKLKKEGDIVTAMLHYPPFPFSQSDSGFTRLFEQFGVKKVVYGHLHGANLRVEPVIEKNGVTYYLTSCDMLDNKLIELY